MSAVRVGVLALQGDTREHLAALRDLGASAVTVRRCSELDDVDALVIPGGESTTMTHLLRDLDMRRPGHVLLGFDHQRESHAHLLLLDRLGPVEHTRRVRQATCENRRPQQRRRCATVVA